MDLALAILLWVGVVLGALLALLLLVPLDARAEGRIVGGELDGRARLRWGGGFLSVRFGPQGVALHLLGLRILRLRGGGPHEPDGEHARERRRRRPATWYWRHRRTLWRAGVRLLRAAHPRGRLTGRVGLGDPADDAALCTVLSQAGGRWPRLELDVACDWVEEVVELEGRLSAIVWPLELAVVLLLVRFSGDVRRALREPA
ncbi:MAG: hypothetical protein JXB32_17215 [Deltaproteobacteria bacterium]|nr:hypothetical protein [Deltaproteobacteria bacterium]